MVDRLSPHSRLVAEARRESGPSALEGQSAFLRLTTHSRLASPIPGKHMNYPPTI
jgi:hypothetical protein